MDGNRVLQSPSRSPSTTTYSTGPSFDGTSDSSNPNSPHLRQAAFSTIEQYDMYGNAIMPALFHPQQTPNNSHLQYPPTNSDEASQVRRKSSQSSKAADKDASNMHMRRRAQNRASQRAFRERKEKHVKGLEYQLEDLHERHQDLLQSYNKQAEEVSRLSTRLSELSTELQTLRRSSTGACDAPSLPHGGFDAFDAFSSMDAIYQGPSFGFDRNAPALGSDFVLHNFEEPH